MSLRSKIAHANTLEEARKRAEEVAAKIQRETARQIVERLCGEGDNVWQTGMLGLQAKTILPLLEAWSRERKEEIIRKNLAKGIVLLDHVVLDDYDLTLWRVRTNPDFEPSGILHAVAINAEEHDPTDEHAQRLRFPGSTLRHLPVTSVVKVIKTWIGDYGKLAIGTVELRKLDIYRRLFQRHGLKVTNMGADPNQGFFVEEGP